MRVSKDERKLAAHKIAPRVFKWYLINFLLLQIIYIIINFIIPAHSSSSTLLVSMIGVGYVVLLSCFLMVILTIYSIISISVGFGWFYLKPTKRMIRKYDFDINCKVHCWIAPILGIAITDKVEGDTYVK